MSLYVKNLYRFKLEENIIAHYNNSITIILIMITFIKSTMTVFSAQHV